MPADIIPSTEFATGAIPAPEQFDAWRKAISVVFDVAPLPAQGAGFRAAVRAFHLGELLLVDTRFDGQRFLRTRRQARIDWMDHYLVQFYRRGGYVGEVGGESIRTPAGSVSVLDLAQPVDTRATAAECLTLVVPRDVMSTALPGAADLHGRILDPASGGLFGEHLSSLERHLPGLAATQAPRLAQATMQLLATCLQPAGESPSRPTGRSGEWLLARVRRWIEAALDESRDDALEIAAICRAAGVSRSRLYALFRPQGGVQRYIQHRKLLRVHRALADPDRREPIMRVAERHGFRSHAHLSRAFRRRFGYSPSELHADPAEILHARSRDAGNGDARSPRSGARFNDWVRTLRPAAAD